MPHRQTHRGPNPQDHELFASRHFERMGLAVIDLHYLLSKRYGDKAAVKLVGDRFRLTSRQRYALRRIVSSQEQIDAVAQREVRISAIKMDPVMMDGFNVLILAEVLLSRGFVFECLDGTFRDIASVHGSYQRVEETRAAIELIGAVLGKLGAAGAHWLFDRPVSNSGRISHLVLEVAGQHNWSWRSETVRNPDKVLMRGDSIVMSSDRNILAQCGRWFNISRELVGEAPTASASVIRLEYLGINLNGFR